jgi:Tfp pilus assembly protein PilF
VSLQPNNAEARLNLGRNLLHAGKKDEAIAQWKKAVDADPDNLAAYANLARVLSQTGSPDVAEYMNKLKLLEERQQATDRVQQLNNFALQSAKYDNWSQAIGQLKEAIELCQQCPQLGVLRKNIGIIYARTGDAENARQQLELALKLLPDGPEALSVREALRQIHSRTPN